MQGWAEGHTENGDRAAAAPDAIARVLQEEIAAGDFSGAKRFPTERELCARFLASRATIREAISKLKHDGILESRRGSGVYVVGAGQGNSFRIAAKAGNSRERQAQIFELRMAVETAGAALAAERWEDPHIAAIEQAVREMERSVHDRDRAIDADITFHRAIAEATGNAYFNDFVRFLEASLRNNVELSYEPAQWDKGRWTANYTEHRSIYKAIAARHPERARAAMLVHLTTAAEDAGLLAFLGGCSR